MGLLDSCFGGSSDDDSRSAATTNRHINDQLKKDFEELKQTVNILLLGAAECGKSTVMKQIRILYGQEFTKTELTQFTFHARVNVIEMMSLLVRARSKYGYDFDTNTAQQAEEQFLQLEKKLNGRHGTLTEIYTDWNQCRESFSSTTIRELADFSTHLISLVRMLWSEEAIRSCLEHRSELQLLDTTEYLLDRAHHILSPDYEVTKEDIIRARSATSGIQEYKIVTRIGSERLVLRITDVGGQRSQRKKWVHCFCDVENLIYIFSLADYDMTLWEDPEANRLRENLTLFQSIINLTFFQHKTIVVFLNKEDVFRNKLTVQRIPLSKCFDDYPPGNLDVEAAIDHIRSKISSRDSSRGVGRSILFHTTTATASTSFQAIVSGVIRSIMDTCIKELGLVY